MKITITVDVDGNAVSRSYEAENVNWQFAVEDMLDTIENSTKPFKEIPQFEGTMEKLKNL